MWCKHGKLSGVWGVYLVCGVLQPHGNNESCSVVISFLGVSWQAERHALSKKTDLSA